MPHLAPLALAPLALAPLVLALALALSLAVAAPARAGMPAADGEPDAAAAAAEGGASEAEGMVLACGDVTVRFGMANGRAVLEVEGRTIPLVETVSASGARYEAEGDPSTVFWSRGREAMLEIAGERLPPCVAAEGPAAAAEEPGRPAAEPGQAAEEPGRAAEEPAAVPDALLGDWVVTSIGGDPVLEDAPSATIAFAADGGIAGRGSCNRYMTGFEVTGQTVVIGPQIAVTQMACPPPILDQERRFLDAMAAVRAFSIEDVDTLVLSGGEEIVARRATGED